MTIEDLSYVKISSVNLIYRIIDEIDGYIEESNRNNYLTLVPTYESKDTLKNYEEMWIKMRDLIWSITKSSDDYDEKYMKIKFNSNDELPLNKTIEIPSMSNNSF